MELDDYLQGCKKLFFDSIPIFGVLDKSDNVINWHSGIFLNNWGGNQYFSFGSILILVKNRSFNWNQLEICSQINFSDKWEQWTLQLYCR